MGRSEIVVVVGVRDSSSTASFFWAGVPPIFFFALLRFVLVVPSPVVDVFTVFMSVLVSEPDESSCWLTVLHSSSILLWIWNYSTEFCLI